MEDLTKICRRLRYFILTSTSKAGSGHVTSSLSAVELMAVLFYSRSQENPDLIGDELSSDMSSSFGGNHALSARGGCHGHFRFDLDKPEFINNDRLIFSKGHASPLFYALYAGAGKVSEEEILTLRQFDSVLEGHPTKRFKYTEVPTGSLGQGLSAGVGMALSAKLDNLDYLTYVLLGDGEIAEGQIWEALEIASHYKLNNLVGAIDVNRLGQTGETLLGHDLVTIENRIKAFGWRTYVVSDGHNLDEVEKAYQFVISELSKEESPYMIIAKTVKGKGVSFLEDKGGWHGRALSEDECKKALTELGDIDKSKICKVNKPESAISNFKFPISNQIPNANSKNKKVIPIYNIQSTIYTLGDHVATREAYGQALVELGKVYEDIVVFDGDLSNSTFSELFKKEIPERYFEMFIAEQNMVSVALGMSERGKVPFISTYGGFITRAFDQVRMAHLGGNHIVICGSHAGVVTGQDGPSQMGLEDMSFFRSLPNITIFYPSDGVSAYKLTELAYGEKGLVYIRTTRPKTPVIYDNDEKFEVGGSKLLKHSDRDVMAVVCIGVTVYETLKAYDELEKEGIKIRVVDAYSIKPVDSKTILKAAKETKAIITVEDHYITGGLGDAVLEVLADKKSVPVYKMGVTKIPRSGKPEELLEFEEIDAKAIVNKVKDILK